MQENVITFVSDFQLVQYCNIVSRSAVLMEDQFCINREGRKK